MAEELKPCPFCGGEANVYMQDDDWNYGSYIVECNNCCACTDTIGNDKETAIEAWNRRVKK